MKARTSPYLDEYIKYKRRRMFEKIRVWLLESKLKTIPQYNNKVEEEYKIKGANIEIPRTRHLDNMMKRHKPLRILTPMNSKTYVKNIANPVEKRKLLLALRKVFPLRPTILNPEYLKVRKQVNEMKKATSYTATYRQFLRPLLARRIR